MPDNVQNVQLLDLPPELLLMIMEQLDLNSIGKFHQVCTKFQFVNGEHAILKASIRASLHRLQTTAGVFYLDVGDTAASFMATLCKFFTYRRLAEHRPAGGIWRFSALQEAMLFVRILQGTHPNWPSPTGMLNLTWPLRTVESFLRIQMVSPGSLRRRGTLRFLQLVMRVTIPHGGAANFGLRGQDELDKLAHLLSEDDLCDLDRDFNEEDAEVIFLKPFKDLSVKSHFADRFHEYFPLSAKYQAQATDLLDLPALPTIVGVRFSLRREDSRKLLLAAITTGRHLSELCRAKILDDMVISWESHSDFCTEL